MDGFLVLDRRGKPLGKKKTWSWSFPFVFSPAEVEQIKQESETWINKPAYIQRASYTADAGITILGEPIPISA